MTYANVTIIMATFNGELWLEEQLSSIRQQGYQDWTLLISDDGSSDRTLEITKRAMLEDERICLLPSRSGCAGHVGNFEYLLVAALDAGAKYILLADQDDIWEPHKLTALLATLTATSDTASVAFSDMELISATGESLGSFMNYLRFKGNLAPDELLRQNFLAGCSMALHVRILDLALPFPAGLENHDWWLGLCAAISSDLKYCPEKLVRYRQHTGNTVGARGKMFRVREIIPVLRRQRRVFQSKVGAVQQLVDRLSQRGSPVPVALENYTQTFYGEGGGQALRLLGSDFKPRSKALLLLQVLSLSVLFRGK